MDRKGIEQVYRVFFTLNEKDRNYSEKWEMVEVTRDYDEHTITTHWHSRWNSSYDKVETIKY